MSSSRPLAADLASGIPGVGMSPPARSGTARSRHLQALQRPSRCAERVERGADGGAVPDVPPLRPLAPLVDTDDLRVDLGLVAEMPRQLRERVLPETVLLLMAAHGQAH